MQPKLPDVISSYVEASKLPRRRTVWALFAGDASRKDFAEKIKSRGTTPSLRIFCSW
jgi:hypothetical protein